MRKSGEYGILGNDAFVSTPLITFFEDSHKTDKLKTKTELRLLKIHIKCIIYGKILYKTITIFG